MQKNNNSTKDYQLQQTYHLRRFIQGLRALRPPQV